MVSYAAIAQQTITDSPDIQSVFEYLDKQAQPVAQEKNPLQVISPAIFEMHQRVTNLSLALSKDRLPRTLSNSVDTAFSSFTDYYVMINSISPPTDTTEMEEYYKEADYSRKLVDFTFRLFRKIGGRGTQHYEPVALSDADRKMFSDELESLKKGMLIPTFATQAAMAKRSATTSWVSWVIFIFWIFMLTDIGQAIFALIRIAFSQK